MRHWSFIWNQVISYISYPLTQTFIIIIYHAIKVERQFIITNLSLFRCDCVSKEDWLLVKQNGVCTCVRWGDLLLRACGYHYITQFVKLMLKRKLDIANVLPLFVITAIIYVHYIKLYHAPRVYHTYMYWCRLFSIRYSKNDITKWHHASENRRRYNKTHTCYAPYSSIVRPPSKDYFLHVFTHWVNV